MNHISMPENAARIIDRLHREGYEAYIVGGCVRDAILGKEPNDWDITTSARPDQVKQLFRRTIDTGIQHGTVTVMMGNEGYEVTTYRIDGKYEGHRRPQNVSFTTSLAEDLLRRDFTINAMAYNDIEGLVDLYDGIGDLKRGVIRAVGVAQHRFDEDALRILRAVRFAAQLDFEIDGQTRQAILKKREFLSEISAERIQVELTKLLVSKHPEKLIDAYHLGITKVVFPEFDAMMEMPQHNPHHCYTVGEHTIKTMQYIESDMGLRWAALLHDIGKIQTRTTDDKGTDHFYQHAKAGTALARNVLSRMRLDNHTIRRVLRIVEWHDYGMSGDINKPALRKAICKMGGIDYFSDILKMRYADTMAQSDFLREEKLARIRQMEQMYHEMISAADCMTIKQLKIDGNDLRRMGIAPGKEMGIILNQLLDDVLEEPEHNNVEYLMHKVEKLYDADSGCIMKR